MLRHLLPNVILLSLLFSSFCQADDLAETLEIRFNDSAAIELKSKATQLQSSVAIYEYVRNHFKYALYQGSRSNSINTFGAQRGNALDISSVLIAMLRSQNIPARYATGLVRIPAEQLNNWLGVKNIDLAASLLTEIGLAQVQLAADRSYVEFEHVWVQALVDFSFYRGVLSSGITMDCAVQRQQCQWIDLDPSYKQNQYPENPIDAFPHVSFDYDSYYNAIKDQNAALIGKNPLEIYQDQVRHYVNAYYPGRSLSDAAYQGDIIASHAGVLPASLPLAVIGTHRNYDSVDQHDAAAALGNESRLWAKYLNVSLSTGGHTFNSRAIRLAELGNQRLSFHLRGGAILRQALMLGTEELLAVNLDGSLLDTNNNVIGIDSPFSLSLKLDGRAKTNGLDSDLILSDYSQLRLGGYTVIGIGGETSNEAQVQRAKDDLLTAAQGYPVVFNPAEPNIPYIDANVSGEYEVGIDYQLINSEQATDDLTGGLLETAIYSYFQQVNQQRRQLDALHHTITPLNGLVGIANSVVDVEYDNGSPFAIIPGGLVLDMKGIRVIETRRIDTTGGINNRTFDLLTHIWSSLEHEVWQQLTGYDAISTVRGVQIALANGANLLEIKHNTTENTFDVGMTQLGFVKGVVPTPLTPRETEVFDKKLVTWYAFPDDGQEHSFEGLWNILPPDFQPWQLNAIYLNTAENVDDWIVIVDDMEEALKAGIVAYGSLCELGSPGYNFGGQYHSGPCDTVLSELESYFNTTTSDDRYKLVDLNQGFDPLDTFYRSRPIPINQHDLSVIGQIRNQLSIDLNYQWTRFLIPSTLSLGNQFSFSVSIEQTFDGASAEPYLINSRFRISNLSGSFGGGYVDSSNLLEQYVPSETPIAITPDFDNSIFTNQQNVSVSNNDLIRTPSTIDPVSTVTGNMYHDETDFLIKNRGIDYLLTRTYNSNNADKLSSLGYGWTHAYNLTLTAKDAGNCPNCTDPNNSNNVTGSIVYSDERGGDHVYLVNETTQAISNPPGEYDTLALNTPSAGQHQLHFRNGVIYTFEGATDLTTVAGGTARLKSIADPYGNQLNLTYNTAGQLETVKDNLAISGRTGLTFTYYSSGLLSSVQDWTGRWVQFSYYSDDTLAITRDTRGFDWTYNYKAGTHLLRTIAKPVLRNGQAVYTEFDYYKNNKAYDYINAQGERESLVYDLHRARTTITDPRGNQYQHTYAVDSGALTKLVEPDGAVKTFANTADGLRYQKTDGHGQTTRYSYQSDRSISTPASTSNTNGLVTREQDALLKNIDYSYGVYDQITEIKDKRGHSMRYSYYPANDTANRAVKGKLNEVRTTLNGQDVLLEKHYWQANGNLDEKRRYLYPNNTNAYHASYYFYDSHGLYLEQISEARTTDGMTSEQNRDILYNYDELGRLNVETLLRVLDINNLSSFVGTATIYNYDEQDRLILRAKARDHFNGNYTYENYQEWVYDGNGKLTQERTRYLIPDPDILRVYAIHDYDAADRRYRTTDILGNETHYRYDENGNLIEQTDANGHTTKIEYDPMNRQTAVIDANGRRTDMQYDLAGRLIATKDSNGHTRRNQYDALGRLIQTSSEQGRSSQIQYDANGNPTHSLDANAIANPQHPKNNQNASVYREYDELNRLTLERDADNGDTTYSYDLLGNITAITDAEGQTTQFEYDLYNGVRVITDPVIETPNDATTIMRRNEAGLPLIISGRDGRGGIYSYDDYNRLTQVSHSFYNLETLQTETIEENYQYDAYGDLIQVSNDAVSYSYDYTIRHELKSKTDSRLNKSLSWTYDPIGNIDTKTDYQGHVTNYQYDSTGRLTALQNQQFLQVSYHYDGAGRLIDRILSNGAKTRYQYDDDNRLIQLINSSANGTEVENLNYQQDEVGNITQISNSTTNKTTDYSYDALYRLINVDSSDNTEDRTYSYDKVGNRKTETQNGISYYYCYHPTDCTQPPQGNRLYSIRTGSQTGSIYRQFFYDTAGRINAKTNELGQLIYGINYNAKGRAQSIVTPNGSQQFQYDPNDYRIKKDNQLYHLEGEHLEATYSDTGELKNSYFRGVIVDEIVNGYTYHSQAPGDRTNYTFHHDHLNSVTALTGHNGTIEETTRYDAFGEILNPASLNSGNELLYTGRQLDRETGLVYYRARYYDTEIDRFITEDPLGFEAGVNFYAYVNNNPINFNDPSGHVSIKPLTKPLITGLSKLKVHRHHTIPKEILKTLPPEIAKSSIVRGVRGNPNKWPVPIDIHKQIHKGAGGGLYNEAFKARLNKLSPSNLTAENVVKIRDSLVKEFGI